MNKNILEMLLKIMEMFKEVILLKSDLFTKCKSNF